MAVPGLDEDHPLTRFLFACNRLYARNFHHVEVLSPCPLPKDGPAIVICNHISAADPFLVQGTSHRVIRWMMAKEYFDLPIIRTLCGKLGFIPVMRRGRDSTSLKAALRTLDAGDVLGLFPEGRIAPTKALLPFQPGINVLAGRTGAPVFPVVVEKFPRNTTMLGGLLSPRSAKILYGRAMPRSVANSTESAVFRHEMQGLQRQALAHKPPR